MMVTPGCVFLPKATETLAEIDRLDRAAACIAAKDGRGAVEHLHAHVQEHPEQVMVRAYLAEQLFRLSEFPRAKAEFTQFIADAQNEAETGPVSAHRTHGHTRLMSIYETQGDTYRENLHRGIALVVMVETWNPTERDTATANTALRKAIEALNAARDERPACGRTALYLADAYRLLGQSVPSQQALWVARRATPIEFTDAEKRRLLLGR
ncbi:MAG: hypothetical protein ACRCZF_03570 [Gemmataceae bacterium]